MSLKNYKEIDTNKVEMNIVIAKDVFETAVNNVFRKNAKHISIPGFRKGKATRGLVEKFYGKTVFYEDAINDLLPSEIDAAAKETPFKIAGMPEVTDVDFENEEGVVCVVTFVRYPDVKLGEYKGLKVEKVTVETTDAEVDAELERVRARYSRTIAVTDRAAAMGDTVDINYEGFIGDKAFEGGKADNHKLKLGSGAFIPGFEDQIVGKEKDSEFDVVVTFPEDYGAEDLAGKEATFKCKLNGIEFEELPTLDDEFAKDASEFDTLAEYKADIKANIEKRHAAEADVRLAEELTKALIANVEADIPDVLVDKEQDMLVREYDYNLRAQGLSLEMLTKYTGMKASDIKERYKDQAVVNVKKQLAIDEIVKAEKVEASEEDIENKYKEMAEQFGMKVEDVKARITSEDLALDVKSIKAFELVKDAAKVTEKTVTAEEFAKMNAPEEAEKPAKKTTAKKSTTTKKTTAKKAEDGEEKAEKKPAAKKTTAKKADGEEKAEKKPAAKKTTAKKADGEEAEKKTIAKKTTAKKATTAKKTTKKDAE
ncbi:MAG: trigger factor [Clostridia bacterium]|nr:trigger factor [Clostridia bacterium]